MISELQPRTSFRSGLSNYTLAEIIDAASRQRNPKLQVHIFPFTLKLPHVGLQTMFFHQQSTARCSILAKKTPAMDTTSTKNPALLWPWPSQKTCAAHYFCCAVTDRYTGAATASRKLFVWKGTWTLVTLQFSMVKQGSPDWDFLEFKIPILGNNV